MTDTNDSFQALTGRPDVVALFPFVVKICRPDESVVAQFTVEKPGDPPPGPYEGELDGADRMLIEWGNGEVDGHLFLDSAVVTPQPGAIFLPGGLYVPAPEPSEDS